MTGLQAEMVGWSCLTPSISILSVYYSYLSSTMGWIRCIKKFGKACQTWHFCLNVGHWSILKIVHWSKFILWIPHVVQPTSRIKFRKTLLNSLNSTTEPSSLPVNSESTLAIYNSLHDISCCIDVTTAGLMQSLFGKVMYHNRASLLFHTTWYNR